jgi:hypothetical protein
MKVITNSRDIDSYPRWSRVQLFSSISFCRKAINCNVIMFLIRLSLVSNYICQLLQWTFFYLNCFLFVETLCFIGNIDCINSMYALPIHSLHHKRTTWYSYFQNCSHCNENVRYSHWNNGSIYNCNKESLLYLLFKNITILTFIAYLMKVIPEKRHAHYIRYLRFL